MPQGHIFYGATIRVLNKNFLRLLLLFDQFVCRIPIMDNM